MKIVEITHRGNRISFQGDRMTDRGRLEELKALLTEALDALERGEKDFAAGGELVYMIPQNKPEKA